MTQDEILFDVTDGVAVLTLNAPARRNALTVSMAEHLVSVLDEVDGRPEIGALVVAANGPSFCSGADIALLTAAGADPAESSAYEALSRVYESFFRLGQLKVPTIAAVAGSAVGAGMNLALAADLRIVATDARLLSGFLKRGIHPGGGHFVLLERLVGREAAAAMSLFSEEIDGARAVAIGLAWEATEAHLVEDRARELATRVASDPALARLAVRNFRTENGPPQASWAVAMDYERPSQMWSMRRSAS